MNQATNREFIIDAQGVRGEAVNDINHGSKSSIGASAVQLTASDIPCLTGVIVKAAIDNTSGSKIYVGDSNAVTAGLADATDGFELAPGESITVPVDNANKIWVIGSTTSLKAFWLAV